MAMKATKIATAKKLAAKTTAKKQATASKSPRKRQKAVKKTVGTCFVMMPFSEPFNLYYDRLYKPAVIAADLVPVRADDLFRPSPIVSDLWNMIQEAKVLVAELTTKNANVFYELGLAHAIGKPVVLVSETMDDVPFDLQQLRVITYNKDEPTWGNKVTSDITEALKESLEDPIETVPSIFRTKVESQAPEQDKTDLRLESLERQVRRIGRNLEIGRSTRKILPSLVTSMSESLMSESLSEVHGDDEFERWVKTWHRRGLPVAQLEQMVMKSSGIPGSLVEEISSIVRRGK